MIERQLGVLLLHQRRHCFPPQTRGSEHVCLVDRVHGQRWVRGEGTLGGDTGDSFDFGDGVGRCVGRDSVFAGFDTVTKVYAEGVSERSARQPRSDLQIPPMSSRTTMISVPLAISGFNGECASNDSDAKFAGRMLAYNPSAFRSLRRPCSGRTGPTPHFGPPTAPTGR